MSSEPISFKIPCNRTVSLSDKTDKINQMPEIPKPLAETITSLKTAKDVNAIFQIFDLAGKAYGLKSISDNTYEYQGFQLRHSLQIYSDDQVKLLLKVTQLGLNCAPKLVDYIKAGDDDSIVITYHEGCEQERPILYRDVVAQVNRVVKERFLEEMKILLENGLVHNFSTMGIEHLFLNPGTGEILLNGWESLREISPNEKDSLFGQITSNLF